MVRKTYFNFEPVMKTLFSIFILLSMSACGVVETTSYSQQSYPYPIEENTPTPIPLEATKAADDQRIQDEIATAAANPNSAYPMPPTEVPTRAPEIGISADCDSLYDSLIIENNCWTGFVDGLFTFVAVGSDPTNSNQGKLILYTANLETYEQSQPFEYLTPTSSGMASIVEVELPRISIVTEDGSMYSFNINSRSWENE